MWDGFNKRKFPRLALRCEIRIHASQEPQPLVAMTENLGVGGVCVILNKPLERFEKCRIRIELGSGKTEVLECGGRVVWTVPTRVLKDARKHFDTGIEFTDLDAASLDRIRNFIEAEVAKDPEKIVTS
jgi:Tfp pilus assembly protein PilZ